MVNQMMKYVVGSRKMEISWRTVCKGCSEYIHVKSFRSPSFPSVIVLMIEATKPLYKGLANVDVDQGSDLTKYSFP